MNTTTLRAVVASFVSITTVTMALPSASAGIIISFSDYSSDSTSPSVLTAEVEFTVSGSELLVDIYNTSDFEIAQLYFNTDTTLTGLAFDPGSSPNPAWSIDGTGASQDKGADGMGRYNWVIDFGSGANRLDSGLTSLVLDMTGTTTEDTIGTKLSTTPPGSVNALAVIKFESGPGGDSAFGGSVTTIEVPEPASFVFAGCAALAGAMFVVRRRRKAEGGQAHFSDRHPTTGIVDRPKNEPVPGRERLRRLLSLRRAIQLNLLSRTLKKAST